MKYITQQKENIELREKINSLNERYNEDKKKLKMKL